MGAARLFHGDNKDVLAHLLANGYRGKVNLIYIDPPFDSGADYVRKVQLRGVTGSAKVDGETYTLGEQIQYTDIWANDNYLQFMYERLLLLRELLAENGGFYLQCDWRKSHHLRCLIEEVFGQDSLRNEIVWKRTSARSDSKTFNHIHDTIFFVTKGEQFIWNEQRTPYSEEYMGRYFTMVDKKTGRKFQGTDLTARELRSGSTGKPWRGFEPSTKGNHWKYTIEKLDELDASGLIYWPEGGGWPRYKYFLDEAEGLALQSIWADVFVVNSQANERTDYPTQKPEDLIERIIRASSNPGDLVLDCFIGSGTTAAVAQRLGRRWIGCDINKGAIQTTAKRLMGIMREQVSRRDVQLNVPTLPGKEGDDDQTSLAAQLSFAVYRVNDYDLQVQHNEAVNLACEHLGITRTRSDAFFDGALGKRLAKIIPFNHPLTPLDLEEVKRELSARPEETRDVAVVCLGKETAVEAWLEEWNRLRKSGDVPNKIEVIELRSDPKYGGFFQHQPARARVGVKRMTSKGDRKGRPDVIRVEIKDFISPAILERLKQQAGILTPQIDDWRAMVDSVMIDAAYDGETFNIALADVPAKKNDLVAGDYELDAPKGKTTVAVKITDMLGEEVLDTKTV
jgi:adenine-specific DNA-methyltransferase